MAPIVHPSPKHTIPSIVIGGYLGAGKTTLVNHLLRQAQGLRIAVLVNDFGEIGIDADLIVSTDGEVMQLAGGCLCCSVGSDLIGALIALGERSPLPDLLLIETSGVALPGAVARSVKLAPQIEVDAVMVLADAPSVREQAQDRHVGDTVRQQLQDADLLVLNKVDLIDDAALTDIRSWLAMQAPHARLIEACDAAVPLALVCALADEVDSPRSLERQSGGLFAGDASGLRRARRKPSAAKAFDSLSLTVEGPVNVKRLAHRLIADETGVIRAKGVLCNRIEGHAKHPVAPGLPASEFVVLQITGRRVDIRAFAPRHQDPLPSDGRLVVIGVRGQLDRERIETIIRDAQQVEEK
jgi:G3E family GTPase